jgi:hypothetical protein
MRAVLGHAIKRSRKTAAEPIGVGFKGPYELTLPTSLKPDPRLIALVRILARQAARDFVQAAWDDQEKSASLRCSTPRMMDCVSTIRKA